MSKSRLSKSTFIRGLQCEKSLYLYKHHYRLKDPTPSSLQAVFDQGTNIGLLAQELFPNGADASPENHFKMFESVRKTQKFISQGESIIYEATFLYNNVLAALDILVKDNDGWKAYEVKSSTKVSETYIKDAAIQYHTITNSGVDLKDISIVHINNQYTREGELDIHQLFTIESVYDQVLEFLPRIPNEVRRLKNVIESSEIPNVDIGPHCSDPYDCDFKGTCWKHIPDYSVFNISRLNKDKKFDLYNQGVITLDDIDLKERNLYKKRVAFDQDLIDSLEKEPKDLTTFTILKQIQFLTDNKLRAEVFEVELYKRLVKPITLIAMILLAMLFIFGSTRDATLGRKIFFGVAIGLSFELISRIGGALALSFDFSPLLSTFVPAIAIMIIATIVLINKSIH